jgi:hypothetical protein
MSNRRAIWVAAIGLAAAAAQGCAGREASLAQIIERHTEARGGAAAIDRVNSAAIDVDIRERGQTYLVKYHAVADPAPRARVDVVVDGRTVYSEGIEDDGVWLWDRSEPAAKASEAVDAADALFHGVEFNLVGLHRYERRGHRLKAMPREKIDGVSYYVLEVAYSTGPRSYFYIDPETWLIARRRDERAYHPDLDPTKTRVESRYSDYRQAAGVLFNDKSEDFNLDSGELLATNTVLKRVINPELPANLFDRSYNP